MIGMKLIRERAFKRYDTRIVDATIDKTIEVTDKDIEKAICQDHQKCAFALAIKRKTGADWVDVSNSRVLIKTGVRTATRWMLPLIAQKQIKFFDTHEGKMAPCKLELKAPCVHSVMGARDKRSRHETRIGAHTKHNKRRRNPTR